MVGEERITRCPYCGKIYETHYGITDYFKYKDRIVTMRQHDDCGQFITEDIDSLGFSRYDMSEDFRKELLYPTYYATLENLNKGLSEEELVASTLPIIKQRIGEDKEGLFAANIQNIKIIIESVVGQINTHDIYSVKLTDEVENELVWHHRTCW